MDKREHKSLPTIKSITPTICNIMDIEYPELCSSLPLCNYSDDFKRITENFIADKIVIFAPDAIGFHLYRYKPVVFDSIEKTMSLKIKLQSIYPTKTPIWFMPNEVLQVLTTIGIMKYEKTVLKCDTLFDALIGSGKKVAIIAVENSSVDKIFRNREIDYYSEKYDPQVTERVIEIIKKDKHDLIFAYQQEYDDKLHYGTPYDVHAIKAAENNISDFNKIVKLSEKYWKNYNIMFCFTPDHGAHIDPLTKKGDHGSSESDDMESLHYFKFVENNISKI